MNALHHISNRARVFAEMFRALRPNGKLVLAAFSPSEFRLMDAIHAAADRRHPHPPNRFANWKVFLQRLGFQVRRFCGAHQELLVARRTS